MNNNLLHKISWQLDAFIEGGYWPNAHILSDEIKEALAFGDREPLSDADLVKVILNAVVDAGNYEVTARDIEESKEAITVARAIEKAHGII